MSHYLESNYKVHGKKYFGKRTISYTRKSRAVEKILIILNNNFKISIIHKIYFMLHHKTFANSVSSNVH
jgi:hypothetical protein